MRQAGRGRGASTPPPQRTVAEAAGAPPSRTQRPGRPPATASTSPRPISGPDASSGGDLGAQLAACTLGERRLVQLVARYGLATVRACLEALLDRAEGLMRSEILGMPDGSYHGRAIVEDDGHG